MALVGAWQQITNFFKRAPKELEEKKDEVMVKSGDSIADTMRTRITSQQIEGPPLDPKTVKQKIRDGRINLTLISTGSYVQSFGVQYLDDNTMQIGPTDERNQTLSIFLEYGTENMPARPHIRPALRDLNKTIPKILKDQGFEFTGKKP